MEQPQPNEMQIEVSQILGLDIPNQCPPGIQASLQLLQTHATILRQYTSMLSKESKAELQECEGER
jgi:hypothetical protein